MKLHISITVALLLVVAQTKGMEQEEEGNKALEDQVTLFYSDIAKTLKHLKESMIEEEATERNAALPIENALQNFEAIQKAGNVALFRLIAENDPITEINNNRQSKKYHTPELSSHEQ
jgi:hypothetical protein